MVNSATHICGENPEMKFLTHVAEDDPLLLGMLQSMCVMRNLVALGFDLVPGRSVVFLLTQTRALSTCAQS